MRRREFIVLLGSASTLSLLARAQTTNIRRLAILSDESASLAALTLQPFAKRLQDFGYIEGRNIAIERRFAAGTARRLRPI
jgi:putative tryptophan/tyrosine transport system substrate-binding protein